MRALPLASKLFFVGCCLLALLYWARFSPSNEASLHTGSKIGEATLAQWERTSTNTQLPDLFTPGRSASKDAPPVLTSITKTPYDIQLGGHFEFVNNEGNKAYRCSLQNRHTNERWTLAENQDCCDNAVHIERISPPAHGKISVELFDRRFNRRIQLSTEVPTVELVAVELEDPANDAVPLTLHDGPEFFVSGHYAYQVQDIDLETPQATVIRIDLETMDEERFCLSAFAP